MNVPQRPFFRFFALTLIFALCGGMVSSCGNDDADDVTLSPFNGLWELCMINGCQVTDPLQIDRYMFMADPSDPQSDAGIGYYYYHLASDPQQWQSVDIKWELLPSKNLKITASRGGGTFEWMVRQASGYVEMRMYDPQTQTESVYKK